MREGGIMSTELAVEVLLLAIFFVIIIEGNILEGRLEDILTEMKKMEWHVSQHNDDLK